MLTCWFNSTGPITKQAQSIQKLRETNIQNTFASTGPAIHLAQNIQN